VPTTVCCRCCCCCDQVAFDLIHTHAHTDSDAMTEARSSSNASTMPVRTGDSARGSAEQLVAPAPQTFQLEVWRACARVCCCVRACSRPPQIVCETDGALSCSCNSTSRYAVRARARVDVRVSHIMRSRSRADVKSAQAALVLLDSAQTQLHGALTAIEHLLH
jgi:hypothetical protein